ncbi:transmembrane protein 6/97 [Podospora australis]|uniref:Efficient mitochondria targeting-associated protein 19 n=1 Tax=Podospora australis TaxID=1536484 RepID=A0AAN6WMW1_9PEZI|nr:transmembrane protein 6/97 [Podospora australis]
MTVYNDTWRNSVWLSWFYIQFPITVLIDLLETIYPSSLYLPESSPLHAVWQVKQWYIQTYNDPILKWTAATGPQHSSWIGLFMHLEFFFLVPVMMYAMYRMGIQQRGTSGADELLYFVYALEVAFTTGVIFYDSFFWDPAVYSDNLKWTLRVQFYAPFLFVPILGAIDMGSRILQRIRNADRIVEAAKKQK